MVLVYSTEQGSICSVCNRQLRNCKCKSKAMNNISKDGIVKISRETKGRKGKGVTLITGLPLTELELKNLSKRLKQLCGTGGTVKSGVIEIQGDNRTVIFNELKAMDYQVKLAGG